MYVCIHSIQKNVVSTQQGYSEFGSFKTRHDASLENALFRIEKFMLDEMFQWLCFKFAHTLAYKNWITSNCYLVCLIMYFLFLKSKNQAAQWVILEQKVQNMH